MQCLFVSTSLRVSKTLDPERKSVDSHNTYKDGKKNEEQDLQDSVFPRLGWTSLPAVICIEWCKTRAQADHWAEEVRYLIEEQCYVLQFFCWHSTWWTGWQVLIETDDPTLEQGSKVYALWQAALREDLRKHFEQMWRNTERYVEISDGIITDSPARAS